jgi:hypothetical protein
MANTEFRGPILLPQEVVDAMAGKADDSAVVHLSGTETIGGAKTFSVAPQVPVGALLANPVRRDDARLTDARTPTAHAATHAPGQPDALTGYQPSNTALTQIAGLTGMSDGQLLRRVSGAWAASALTKADVGLGNVDNTSDASKPVSTATATALSGKVDNNDARLTNARTPTAHASTHAPGGSDALTGYQATSEKDAANGYLGVDAGGFVPTNKQYAASTTTYGIIRLQGDLAGTAASPTVPGLAGKADSNHEHTRFAVRSITYAATITPDVSVFGDVINISATGALTINVPTGTPADREQLRIAVFANGGARVVTMAAGYGLSTGITSRTINVTSGQVAEILVEYFSILAKWCILSAPVTS